MGQDGKQFPIRWRDLKTLDLRAANTQSPSRRPMRVDLRGGNIFVSRQVLHRADVRRGLQKANFQHPTPTMEL
jgi:hypothetical protein